jgi:CheY-like chemotaxis protein
MMPEIDGQQALRESRLMEKAKGIAGPNHVKIIMTTALGDRAYVQGSFPRPTT